MLNNFLMPAASDCHRRSVLIKAVRNIQNYLLLAVVATFSSYAMCAEPWPTTHFEVVVAKPSSSGNTFLDIYNSVMGNVGQAEDGPYPLAHDQQVALEQHLHEAALQLQEWGFPPPALQLQTPIINLRNGLPRAYNSVYHIFLFKDEEIVEDRPRPAPGHYNGPHCSALKYSMPYMMINTLNWKLDTVLKLPDVKLPSGELDKGRHFSRLADKDFSKAIETAGHELFHAVQLATPLFQDNCTNLPSQRWVSEGTANAVGFDLVSLLRGERMLANQKPEKRWGWKQYRKGLEDISPDYLKIDMPYRASSFWRYLGELTALRKQKGKGGAKPGPKPEKADYSYLVKLFNQHGVDLGDTTDQLKWLHEGLQGAPRIGVGLDRVLPNFYSVFADYGKYRAKPSVNFYHASDWRAFAFGNKGNECPQIALTNTKRSGTVSLLLNARAGACFSITRGEGLPMTAITATVELVASSEAGAQQLALSESGGRRVSNDPNTIGVSEDGKEWRANWLWLLEERQPLPMLVTNIAAAPWNTAAQEITVKVTLTAFESTMTEPDAAGAPTRNTPSGAAKEPAVGPKGTRAAVQQSANRQRGRVKAIDPHAAQITREPYQGRCGRKDKALNLCGDQLQIKLALVPGTASLLGAQLGTGGMLQQLIGMGQALNDINAMTLEGMAQMAGGAQAEDGYEISIRVPLIDYGYTGSVDNAQLEVSAANGGNFRAIGPKDIDRSSAHKFPPSGSVTIEEYTPGMLRGTFKGQLVAPEEFSGVTVGTLYPRERQPSLQIARTVEGRFWVAAPWQGDARYRRIDNPNMQQSIADDLSELMPSADGNYNSGPGAATQSSGGAGGNGSGSSCTCSCAELAKVEKISDALEGDSMPNPDQMGLMMCGMRCGMAYAKCPSN
jgi:hypothetical protein